MRIYLDDHRTPSDNRWKVVRSYYEFVNLIEGLPLHEIEEISFDHDLGDLAMMQSNVETFDYTALGDEKTGMHAAKWFIEEYVLNSIKNPTNDWIRQFPRINVHSANYSGKENIRSYFNSFFKSFKVMTDPVTCYWYKTIDSH